MSKGEPCNRYLRIEAAGRENPIHATEQETTDGEAIRVQQDVAYHIAAAGIASVSLEELLQEIHQELGKVIDTTNIYIALYDEESQSLSFRYQLDEGLPQSVDRSTAPRPLRRGATEYVMRTRTAVLLNEDAIATLVERGEVDPAVCGPVPKVWMGAPLLSQDRVIGVVAVQSYTDPECYTESDLRFLDSISRQLGAAIERMRVEERLRENNAELERANARLMEAAEEIAQLREMRALTAMSHLLTDRVNNAMMVIFAECDRLQALGGALPPEEIGDIAGRILKAATRVSEVIDGLSRTMHPVVEEMPGVGPMFRLPDEE